MKDKDNVIVFPTDRIVNKDKVIIDQKEVKKQYKKIEEQQTAQYVEMSVDDIAVHLIKYFLDLQIRVNTPQFTRDFALVIDTLRGLIYRDFDKKHPSQQLVHEIVSLYDDVKKGPSAKIDYGRVLKNIKKEKKTEKKEVFSENIKGDLKDLKDGDDISFEPDFDV